MLQQTQLEWDGHYHRAAQRRKLTGFLAAGGRHLVLLVYCLFAVAPLLWALSTSLKPRTEVYTNLGLIPHAPTLLNYVFVIGQTKFGLWFGNTLLIALATTVLAIIIATLGGYAMSRYKFWGRNLYGNTLLIVQMFPGVM